MPFVPVFISKSQFLSPYLSTLNFSLHRRKNEFESKFSDLEAGTLVEVEDK